MNLLLPKTFARVPTTSPLFFLAGPIQGGADWQATCSEMLADRIPDCTIASPRNLDWTHRLFKFRMNGPEDTFERQTDWERHYLRQAARIARAGCIIFWLPCESLTEPRADGSPYARDTYGELGEWRTHLENNRNVRVAIGAEADFPGLSVLKRNFQLTLGLDYPIYTSLEETVCAAVSLSKK
jgi:hypothetical protein